MRRGVVLAATVVLAMVGCGPSGPHPTSQVSPPVIHRHSGGRVTTSPTPTITRLDEIVLGADPSETPAPWTHVLFIPFGNDPDELRYVPAHEAPTIEPTSFAVAADGSFWIMDPANHRLCHFSGKGMLVSQVLGFHALSRDVAIYGPDVLAMRQYQFGRLVRISPAGTLERYEFKLHRHSLYVSDIIPSGDTLVVRSSGYTRPVATGPTGFYEATLHAPVPDLLELPGVPLQSRRWFQLHDSGPQDLVLDFITPEGTTEQPIHIQIVDRPVSGSQQLEGLVGAGGYVAGDGDISLYVKMSVSLPDGSQVGARYLLRMGSSPMLWERLPDPKGVDDDDQWRHLTRGPDGDLYLMVTDKDGIRIYRRPP